MCINRHIHSIHTYTHMHTHTHINIYIYDNLLIYIILYIYAHSGTWNAFLILYHLCVCLDKVRAQANKRRETQKD